MIRYIISPSQPEKHYIDIEARFETNGAAEMKIHLPAWRPGRYELGNFAQNIRKWFAYNENGNELASYKSTKDCWIVETGGCKVVSIQYDYFSYLLDAGNTYYDINQLYINPVNCFLYIKDRIQEPCSIEIKNLPDSYQIVSSMVFDASHKTEVSDFHTLADSPFFATQDIKQSEFTIGGYHFKISIVGNVNPDWQKINTDFEAFCSRQIEMFGELPVKDYHFLFQMPDYKYYHGVEHLASTVICIGPAENMMKDIYNEFLGISSHELFHSWNVKSIRPVEMMPYDYTKENYTVLNYVTEGVTSYYGDLMLLRSGGFNAETYFTKAAKTVERHEHSFGKLYQTLAEASVDAWIDGYKAGAPDRKISFYQKGMIVAWIIDLDIRRETANKKSLDTVMQVLYNDFAKQKKGYSESDYLEIIKLVSGKNYEPFFKKYVWGLDEVEIALNDAVNYIGYRLEKLPNHLFFEDRLGFRMLEAELDKMDVVTHIAPDSPAEMAKMSIRDKIVAVNGTPLLDSNFAEAFKTAIGNVYTIDIMRRGIPMRLVLTENADTYYPIYQIVKTEDATDIQKQNYKDWSGQEF